MDFSLIVDIIACIRMRHEFEESLQSLLRMGYQIAATPGTATHYQQRGILPILSLLKPTDSKADEEEEKSVLFWIQHKKIDLVVNIPEGSSRKEEVTAGYLMRRAAVDFGISLITNVK